MWTKGKFKNFSRRGSSQSQNNAERYELILLSILILTAFIANDSYSSHVNEIKRINVEGVNRGGAVVSDLTNIQDLPLFKGSPKEVQKSIGGTSMDAIFSQPTMPKKEVTKPVPMKVKKVVEYKPDYQRIVDDNFILNAILGEGAIINNQFLPVGTKNGPSIKTRQGFKKSTLIRVSDNKAFLRIDGVTVTLEVR